MERPGKKGAAATAGRDQGAGVAPDEAYLMYAAASGGKRNAQPVRSAAALI
jgi:hypothetical protein